MIGIYKITNKVNNKCYIGQSTNIERRWVDHQVPSVWNNPRSESYNYPLYIAFRKYNLNNFTFEIIEECLPEELNEKEVYWIKYYNSYLQGYNQTPGGNNTSTTIPIYQYDLFGRFIAEYPNISIAASKTNTQYNNLYSCLSRKNNQYCANKYQWSYEKKDYIGPPPIYTPVICFDLEGKRIGEYYCLEEAHKATNCSIEVIRKSCNDHKIHNKNYQWRYWIENPNLQNISAAKPYDNNKKEINQFDLNNNYIKTWNSISEAANELQLTRANLSSACHNRQKTCGGYIWKFKENNNE